MKIIFLNTWKGKIWEKLSDFLSNHINDTDIFCFMETDPNVHKKLQNLLKNHDGIFDLGGLYRDGEEYGQSAFFGKGTNMEEVAKIDIDNEWTGKSIAYRVESGGAKFLLFNVHGVSFPGDKMDTELRLKQSKNIIQFLNDKKIAAIVGGDFNLNPNTKSIDMFEKNGYVNLIKKFNIQDTRGRINAEIYKDQEIQHFADYCFVSTDIKVNKFEVPDVEVSDHLPLILSFEM